MTDELGKGPVVQSAFFHPPDLVGFRKNSAGSTSSTSASLPMISKPTWVTPRSTRLQVGPVHPGFVGEPLLRDLPLVADAPEVRREKLA